ncbi:MAG: hypothetical protein ATN36_08450 [Epulopiscium sp. Nele67-Bin005]|nr:MAG: hypothetical protein ATN36_08450 [Epulopiscium sp. Nele67-Bin005]
MLNLEILIITILYRKVFIMKINVARLLTAIILSTAASLAFISENWWLFIVFSLPALVYFSNAYTKSK